MIIVHRTDIESIESMVIDGETHFLGELRDFRKHEVLARFLPENAHPSIAWCRLKPDQKQEPHTHPIVSMIIICEGNAEVTGNAIKKDVVAGDVILVPVGVTHGFRGTAPNGFYGISIQFEQNSLYDDKNPLVMYK